MAQAKAQKTKNKPKMDIRKPVVLIVLDGWGAGPDDRHGNAIRAANTPVFDTLYRKYPNTTLKCWGKYAGLPGNQIGNSEAGHLNIGAGRVVKQDSVYVSDSIKDGTFFKNTAFKEAIEHTKQNGNRLHLVGLLSNGDSAHSSPDHLLALVDLARKERVGKVFIHIFTDGRDSSRFGALKILDKVERYLRPNERIASVMGRFYGMDRNKIWTRTELAYNAIVCGEGIVAPDAKTAILWAYNRGETDEFIIPTLMRDGDGELVAQIRDKDSIIFFNLRSDRTRQLTKAFVQPNFENENSGTFRRSCVPENIKFVAMTDFGPDLPHILTAFPSRDVKNGIVETVGSHGLRQLHIAESEKFAHITYFLNGGYARPVAGEDRIKVASPDVPRYDMVPEMGSYQITSKVIDAIRSDEYDFVAVNFAAPDMIGHTGNFQAAIQTVEIIDECVGKIVRVVLDKGGVVAVTADHGGIDEMVDAETGEIITKHSRNPVPFILVDKKDYKTIKLKNDGALGNIAPTILKVMGIPASKEMTTSLF